MSVKDSVEIIGKLCEAVRKGEDEKVDIFFREISEQLQQRHFYEALLSYRLLFGHLELGYNKSSHKAVDRSMAITEYDGVFDLQWLNCKALELFLPKLDEFTADLEPLGKLLFDRQLAKVLAEAITNISRLQHGSYATTEEDEALLVRLEEVIVALAKKYGVENTENFFNAYHWQKAIDEKIDKQLHPSFHFTKEEAYQKVGMQVRTKEDLFSVGITPIIRKGTRGTIYDAEPLAPEMGMRPPQDFIVMIKWDYEGKPPSTFSNPTSSYTKEQFKRHLEVIAVGEMKKPADD